MVSENECCPKFDPAPWQERWLALDGRKFAKDRVRSFLRIPLNFGAVITRNMAAIQQAGAELRFLDLGQLAFNPLFQGYGAAQPLEPAKSHRASSRAGTSLVAARETAPFGVLPSTRGLRLA